MHFAVEVAEMDNNQYVYSALNGDKHIRLLRLLPSLDQSDRLRGQLFEYPLTQGRQTTHLYEALSYTWGTSHNTKSISIDGKELVITANCHAALAQLRDCFIERVLWVDAICIDQSNKDEREKQVRIMAEVYCKTRQVIIWLGEATPDSDGAMQKIRAVAEGRDTPAEQDNHIPKSITALLERPWFRRVWVLQETAAAQHVVMVCGASQIDGYTFCLGLAPYIDACQGFEVISSVEHLIRGSIFRPKYTETDSGLITLGIRPLGELMDMYHAHDATEPLDRVFAFLGMSSDGLSASELAPNYSISWDVLFRRLIIFLLGPRVSVTTSNSNRAAVISGQGTIIGTVTSVALRSNRNRDFHVTMEFTESYQSCWSSPTWNLHAGVKRAQTGDVLCLLEGASNPMLIRQKGNCFSVIMISVTPTPRQAQPLQTSTLHNFVLIWNLEDSLNSAKDSQLRTWLDVATLGCVKPHPEKRVKTGHLLMGSAHILVAASQFEAAVDQFQKAVDCYNHHLATDDRRRIECLAGMAVAYGSLQKWHEAKEIWECIIRTCYGSSYFFMRTIDFLDNLLPVLQQDEYNYDAKKWQAVHDAINAKRSETMLQDERILEIVEFLDSEVLNILIDQQDPWPVAMERTLIAAARNENSGEAVMKVIFDRLSNVKITEPVFVAAAGNLSCGKELFDMLLLRQGLDAQITQAVLRSAAANSRSNRTLMPFLLGHQGIEMCPEIDKDDVWAALSSFMTGSEPSDARIDALDLAKLYSKTDDTTLLRLLISAMDPTGIPHLRRGLYQFAWDEYKSHRLDEFVQMLPPALEDLIASLTHILLSKVEHAVQKVIELARHQRLDTTKTDVVNEEVVNGCCKSIESGTPAELLRFLDCLYQFGIGFSYHRKDEPPSTQSAILPASLSRDPRFLKILIEKKVVSPQMRYFTILSRLPARHKRWRVYSRAPKQRYPPAGMPDWPLYCAIVLAVDPQFIDFLCQSGARVDQNHSSDSPTGTKAAIIQELEQTAAFEAFTRKFLQLMALCHNMATTKLYSNHYEENSVGNSIINVSWEGKSFDEAWRSMDKMVQWDNTKSSQENWDTNKPKRFENVEMWDEWRNDVLEILSSF